MPQSREQFLLARRRIQTVLDYMEAHLDEEHITLNTLAEVASLSRCHFERLYSLRVQETPMATIRRLRLQSARRQLLAGKALSVSDLAVQAGYSSIAAFSRAFSRQFGVPPTGVAVQPPTENIPQLDIVNLQSVPVVRLPYAGRAAEVFRAGDELSWLVARVGAPHWRHWVVHPDGWVDPQRQPNAWVRMWHCIPSTNLPAVAGAERAHMPGGRFARFRFVGQHSADIPLLAGRVQRETGHEVTTGPMLRHFPNVTHYTPPSERVTCLFLPVTR